MCTLLKHIFHNTRHFLLTSNCERGGALSIYNMSQQSGFDVRMHVSKDMHTRTAHTIPASRECNKTSVCWCVLCTYNKQERDTFFILRACSMRSLMTMGGLHHLSANTLRAAASHRRIPHTNSALQRWSTMNCGSVHGNWGWRENCPLAHQKSCKICGAKVLATPGVDLPRRV